MTPATAQSPTATTETPVTIDLQLVTDPVGVALEARVADLPDPVQQDLVTDVFETLVAQQGNLIFQSIRVAHGTLRSYGSRNDYDVEPVTESVEILDATQTGQTVEARWGWTHEAAQYFQFGVSPHTIDGNPILSFIWEDAPQDVRDMFPYSERVDGDPRVFFRSVDHPGIPASRFVQAGMNWLRQELR